MGVNMKIKSQVEGKKHNRVTYNIQQCSKSTMTTLTQFEPIAEAFGVPGAKAFKGIDEIRVDSGT